MPRSVDQPKKRPVTRQHAAELHEAGYQAFQPPIRSSSINNPPSTSSNPEIKHEISAIENLNDTFLNLSLSSPEQSYGEIILLDSSTDSTNTVIESPEKPQIIHPTTPIMTDTTLAEAFKKTRKPAIPQFISPTIFDPAHHDPEEFLKTFDRISIANGWNTDLKMTYFGSFLSGSANRWYEYMVKNKPDNKWTDIVTAFTNEFKSNFSKSAVEDNFDKATQSNTENVKEFFYRLKTLAYDVDLSMPDDRFVKQFERGLHPRYENYYKLVQKPKTTVNDLKEIIDRLGSMKIEDPPQPSTTTSEKRQYIRPFRRNNYSNYQQRNNFSGQRPNTWNYQRQNQSNSFQRSNNTNNNYQHIPTPPRTFHARNTSANATQSRRSHTAPSNETTRTPEGRPKCYICGKLGHLANACWQKTQNSGNRSQAPNATGRQ